jgi:hypothetical protein
MSSDRKTLAKRVLAEQIDDLDEEFEMELNDDGDDRLARFLDDLGEVDLSDEHAERRLYFQELFRLQKELVKLQDRWSTTRRRWWWCSRAATPPARAGRSSASPSG